MITPTTAEKRIKFMATCLCDSFYGDVAKASYRVLEHLGCEIDFPEGQTCCGQPAHNAGDWKSARKVVEHTLEVFKGNEPVVVPSGSCAAMSRHGALLCMEGQSGEADARSMANRTWELCEFIVQGLGVGSWKGRFPKKVALHRSCHTRGTKAYESAVQLLSSIEGLELVEVGELDQCCGFGGTFSVSFPNVSKEMGQLKIEHLIANMPDCIASLDMACAMHFGGMMDRQGIKTPRLHVAQILLQALESVEK
ncbi:(Fe-S)-binding protein [Pelagicoccus sp. SDUM812003]|uniref:(Fe-S)-binding protein n=1 Tax=Pelagicoccus sp. SDUM812003 TaxID=3041267 RepID=UPI00280D2EEA|nr:(Fe-S)-binding protein [Pelagicoccus sp. SDUM812003]MDQ8204628.1 (Fe-S)-binding protein [Pelagicoccus sp. SDUM812003]